MAQRKRGQKRKATGWADWPEELLLDLRFCDLPLSLDGTWIEECITRIGHELDARGITVQPHFWLSEEWFSPDGVPGVAIPFYLAHPRLRRLERKMMLEVEGGGRDECMRLLRHETGHALQHAYQLQRRREWQSLFGRPSTPYPDYYWPNPSSKRFVQHLDGWYAQSHPDEDFAETFAVWLAPRSGWRRRYEGWPALKKLDYVDRLMRDIGGQRPKVTCRDTPYAVGRMHKTLRKHYEQKRERYQPSFSDAYDRDLQELFVDSRDRRRITAAAFLRRNRRELRDLVARWTGESAFTVDQILKQMTGRCSELQLRVDRPEAELKTHFAVLLTARTMRCLYRGQGWHVL